MNRAVPTGFILHPSAFILLIHPFTDQRCLAKAGWGGEESDLAACCQASVQPLEEARPAQDAWPGWGDMQLGSQDGHGHYCIIGLPFRLPIDNLNDFDYLVSVCSRSRFLCGQSL